MATYPSYEKPLLKGRASFIISIDFCSCDGRSHLIFSNQIKKTFAILIKSGIKPAILYADYQG
jgi:hypothetical protein